eukprot:gnl/MRDRNA2_/MRDRNA2_92004_c0_seq1.p1 gnl/MRDRNA2_/MRDRNA2_92004_c0~~gnl/MRDRNA2_/MRDRNA2_92004_c0_seq1.p1  ORF type:complete len:367 (+),score=121.55 gnl/MRDRNA2_/MRDRNA2_92004_c0_seq1:100-1200(+)
MPSSCGGSGSTFGSFGSGGLADISHTGRMQRVGGKAAGFINKKFFHPSTLRNQEKIWAAQEEATTYHQKQKLLILRREEERAVEKMRREMILAGQGSDTQSTFLLADDKEIDPNTPEGEQFLEAKAFQAEQKRRARMLKAPQNEKKAMEDEPVEEASSGSGKKAEKEKMLKSSYREDHVINGHTEVWGSFWFETEKKEDGGRWGYACCKEPKDASIPAKIARKMRCPLAPDAPAPKKVLKDHAASSIMEGLAVLREGAQYAVVEKTNATEKEGKASKAKDLEDEDDADQKGEKRDADDDEDEDEEGDSDAGDADEGNNNDEEAVEKPAKKRRKRNKKKKGPEELPSMTSALQDFRNKDLLELPPHW